MMTMIARGTNLVSTYLIDLGLEIVDHFWRHVFAQDLEEIDPLVPGDRFVSGQFDAFLDLLYGGVLGDEIGVLRLPYRLVAEDLSVLLRVRRSRDRQEQHSQHRRVKLHLREGRGRAEGGKDNYRTVK